MNVPFVSRWFVHAVLLAGLAGCGGAPVAPAPTPAVLSIETGPSVNPSADGTTSRVNLRIYLLRDAAPLLGADFEALRQSDQTILAETLVGRYAESVASGDRKQLTLEIGPDARAVGVFAEFRAPQNNGWRASLPVPAQTGKGPLALTLRVEGQTVALSAGQAN